MDIGKNHELSIDKGKSILIPACVKKYSIQGNAVFYKAAVPLHEKFAKP
jgi:mannose-6-phosphate isomerase class I